MWDEVGMATAIGRTTRHMQVRVTTRSQRSHIYVPRDGVQRPVGAERERMSRRPDIILALAVLARHEVVWVLIGGVVLLVTAQIDYRRWRQVALLGFIVAGALLALVLRFGVVAGGAQRWLAWGDFLSFQPGEIAKLAYIVFAADWLARRA